MSVEKDVERSNSGRMADILFAHLKDILDEQKAASVKKMVQMYRSRDFDQIKLLVALGEYCGIEDLENILKKRIVNGNKAAERLRK